MPARLFVTACESIDPGDCGFFSGPQQKLTRLAFHILDKHDSRSAIFCHQGALNTITDMSAIQVALQWILLTLWRFFSRCPVACMRDGADKHREKEVCIENTRRSPIADFMLGQHRRRWASIKPALGRRLFNYSSSQNTVVLFIELKANIFKFHKRFVFAAVSLWFSFKIHVNSFQMR